MSVVRISSQTDTRLVLEVDLQKLRLQSSMRTHVYSQVRQLVNMESRLDDTGFNNVFFNMLCSFMVFESRHCRECDSNLASTIADLAAKLNSLDS